MTQALHTCSACGKVEPWGEGWVWFADPSPSYLGDPEVRWKACSPACVVSIEAEERERAGLGNVDVRQAAARLAGELLAVAEQDVLDAQAELHAARTRRDLAKRAARCGNHHGGR